MRTKSDSIHYSAADLQRKRSIKIPGQARRTSKYLKCHHISEDLPSFSWACRVFRFETETIEISTEERISKAHARQKTPKPNRSSSPSTFKLINQKPDQDNTDQQRKNWLNIGDIFYFFKFY